jgi:hypothetical protein
MEDRKMTDKGQDAMTDDEITALDKKLASQIGDDIQAIFDHEALFKAARLAIKSLRDQLAGLQEAYDDTKRLARLIDVAMHGEDGAAKQASLCDLVGPASDLRAKLAASEAARNRAALDAAPQAAEHYDDYAVRQFSKLMAEKMAVSRAKGRGGWQDPEQCSVEYLQSLLHEHVAKGDPVDVANICMMLRHYEASTSREYENSQDRIASLSAQLADSEATRVAAEARVEVLEYVLGGVKSAIDTGRNEPLQIWRDQIDIASKGAKP